MKQDDPKLVLYAPHKSERLSYTAHIFFELLVGIKCEITTISDDFLSRQGPKINYSNDVVAAHVLHIPDSGLLWESGIRPIELQAIVVDDLPALFPATRQDCTWPFDLLAMTFFLVTRYEEYLPFQPDNHGRFSASQSAAFRFGFLERPLLHEWAAVVREDLKKNHANLIFTPPKFSCQLTYDIDLAWAFKHKSLIRQVGGGLTDIWHGRYDWVAARLRTVLGKQTDPFFTFDYLDQCHKERDDLPVFFFLLGDRGPFDHNISPRNPALRQLINRISAKYPLGIHPSYRSNQETGRLQLEIERLKAMSDLPVVRSRQHYLLLRFPDTYQMLSAHGIQADYTLGYADALGFRASIAVPFTWYDISRETWTQLVLHPFQVMDVSLKDYMGLSPDSAITRIADLQSKLRRCGGTLTTIWHNSSFSALHGWKAWAAVHQMALGGQSSC